MTRRISPSHILIRQPLNALSRLLPAAQKGDVPSLHQARVATRRLREALPLVATGTRGRKIERDVRRVTQALGPVRELDVALLMLDEFAADPDVPAAALGRLRQAIRRERQSLQTDMWRQLDRVDLAKLRRRAEAAARKSCAATGTGRRRDPGQLAAAEQRAARRAARLTGAIENAAGIYLPDRLHQVRIAVKKLRYALELTRELSGSRALANLRMLKTTQDLLGRMHDLEILITRIRALQGSAGGPSLRLSGELDRLVRRLETECRKLHGQYIASRRKLLSTCEHTLDVAARHAGAASAA